MSQMHPVFIGCGILFATFAAAFLPQIVWPNWPSQWVIGLGGVAGLILVLIDCLRSGEFSTNVGDFRRDERPKAFYFCAAVVATVACIFGPVLIVQALRSFAAE